MLFAIPTLLQHCITICIPENVEIRNIWLLLTERLARNFKKVKTNIYFLDSERRYIGFTMMCVFVCRLNSLILNFKDGFWN